MNERNNGIDLLKIILMLMICTNHVLTHGGVIYNTTNALNYFSFYAIRELCVCAVDCFAIITGYFSYNRKANFKRVLKLWLVAFFYSVLSVLFIKLLNNFVTPLIDIQNRQILASFFPIFNGNWYFRSYVIVFVISPLINKVLDYISISKSKIVLVLLFILFTVPTLYKDYVFSYGFSAIWLLALYIIGALINKSGVLKDLNKNILLFLYILCCFITWVLHAYFDITKFGNYTSPTIVLSAIFLVMYFSKLNINNKYIKLISSLTFGIYMLHDNEYIRTYFITNKFMFINNYNFIIGSCLIIIFALIIFACSLIIEFIRLFIFNKIKINNFCDKIIDSIKIILLNTN